MATSPMAYTGRSAADPVLNAGTGDAWDGQFIYDPNVVQTPNGYVMAYLAVSPEGTVPTPFTAFGYATSADGVTWTKSSANPILSSKDHQNWQGMFLANLLYQNGALLLYFDLQQAVEDHWRHRCLPGDAYGLLSILTRWFDSHHQGAVELQMQARGGESRLAQPGEMLFQCRGVLARATQPRQKVCGVPAALDLGAALQRLPAVGRTSANVSASSATRSMCRKTPPGGRSRATNP